MSIGNRLLNIIEVRLKESASSIEKLLVDSP